MVVVVVVRSFIHFDATSVGVTMPTVHIAILVSYFVDEPVHRILDVPYAQVDLVKIPMIHVLSLLAGFVDKTLEEESPCCADTPSIFANTYTWNVRREFSR